MFCPPGGVGGWGGEPPQGGGPPPHTDIAQSVANIFFGTEYEYIRNPHLDPNTNTNILGILFCHEYDYEYIHNISVDQIRIFEYFCHKYSIIIIE